MAPAPRGRISTARLASGLHFAYYSADHGLGRAMSQDAFERAELACACRLVGPGDVVIDGGAHLGAYALPLAQRVGPSGRVHAFEPHPETRAVLAQAVALNGFEGRLSISSAALGDAARRGALLTSRHCSGHPHAHLILPDAKGSCTERAVPIQIVALDEVGIGGRVTLIKLDVEGAELLAIRGARQLIRRDRPAMLCELGDEQLARVSGGTSADVMSALAAAGYGAYEIAPDGATGRRLHGPPTARVSTVLFLPDD